ADSEMEVRMAGGINTGIFLHTHTHTHTHAYIQTQRHSLLHTSRYTHTYTHTHPISDRGLLGELCNAHQPQTYQSLCISVVHTHACTHAHTLRHTHTHTHTHTNPHESRALFWALKSVNESVKDIFISGNGQDRAAFMSLRTLTADKHVDT